MAAYDKAPCNDTVSKADNNQYGWDMAKVQWQQILKSQWNSSSSPLHVDLTNPQVSIFGWGL